MTANYSITRYSTARFDVQEAREATWARRGALFFLQLLILTVLLHHWAGLGTPAAMNLLAVSIVGLLIAAGIALASLVRIWFGGQTGAAQAFAALFIVGVGLAVPLFYLSHVAFLPPLTDVATTPDQPLAFKALLSQRPADANPITDPDTTAIDHQLEAYPDIEPMALERSAPEVFSLVQEAVERLGWTIVVSEPPGESGVGRIEATDHTLIMGFTDDVIVQVKGDDAHAVIDVRSVSRYGMHDLGTNAARIGALFGEVTAALEKGEKTVLEQVEPKEEDSTDQSKPPKKPVKKGARNRR